MMHRLAARDRRRRDRRVPYVVLAVSLLMTAVTAVYSHRVVVTQAATEVSDRGRFIGLMRTVAMRLEAQFHALEIAAPATDIATLDVTGIVRRALDSVPLAGFRVRLYRGLDTAATSLVYESSDARLFVPELGYRAGTGVKVFGTPWALMIEASVAAGMSDDVDPVPTVLIAGSLLSMLLFGLTMGRVRAQISAYENELRYRDLFNGTPIPMWLYDVESLTILAVNDAAVANYGYTRTEFLGLTINDLRATDEDDGPSDKLPRATASYHAAGISRHRKKDGSEIEVEITAHYIRFEGQKSSIVVANDISDRRRAEVAVHESEERLRQMAEYINEAFFVVDTRSGRPLYISPTWSEIWGRPIAEAYDPRTWLAAVHPDDRDALAGAAMSVAKGESATNIFRVVRPDSSVRWVRGRSFPVRDAAGDVYRMVGVAEDITELRQVESRFAQSQKMEAIGRLAGGIAHDFNNLLTVILGEASELASGGLSGAESAASVHEIEAAGHRAASLTRQLLAFSRRQIVDPVVFNLTDAVASMSNMCSRLIGEDIELETRMSPSTWQVRADPGQVEQVLANLVVNARDAMPDGGRITIETDNVTVNETAVDTLAELRAGDYVCMIVSDNGTGMTDEVRARLFEPFFTTKEVGQGTGLGLATCYGIVKQAGGQMTVYSELGLGTTVRVFLPRGLAESQAPNAVEPGALPRGEETILLVEDEPAVRRVVVRLLQAQGYSLLEAGDGVEAARISAEHPGQIHLLLTDVVLPGIGGREVAEQARLQRPDIKVLFASGYTDDVILKHRLLQNDFALLQKPFSRETVARKVREVLDAA